MFNELKGLLKQSAIYGIGSIITPFVGFIMLPIYTRFLTPEDYGALAITAVVTAILSIFITMGINAGLIRIYFSYNDKKERDEVIISSLIFSFISSLAIILILWLFSYDISKLVLDFPNGELYFKLIILTTGLNAGVTNFLSVLRAEGKSVVYTTITIVRLILSLSLNILFVVFLRRNVQGILEAGLISGIVSIVILLPIAVKGKKGALSLVKIKEVLYFGVPLIPGSLAAWILTMSDRYFLKHYATLEEVGLYSIGYKIATIVSITITQPFKIAWPPYMFSVVNKENAKEIYKKVLVYYVYIAIWAGLCLSVFAREGLYILATPVYYSAYMVVPLIVISYILLGMDGILVAGIHIAKKTKYASISFVAAALINLILNYLFIPYWGMMGAALATVLSYIALNILYFVISQKLYPIDHEFKRIAMMFCVGFVIYGFSGLVVGEGLIQNILIKSALVMMYPVLLFFLNFYAKEELDKIQQITQLKLAPKFNRIVSLCIKR